MKKLGTLRWWSLALSLVLAMIGSHQPCSAAGPNDVDSLIARLKGVTPQENQKIYNWEFWMKVEADPHPTAAGPVNVRFSFSPNLDFGPTTISIGDIDNIEYNGAQSWVVQAAPADTFTYDLQMTIPPDDTGGIRITAESGKFKSYLHAYFVQRGDTIQFHNINPRLVTSGSREWIRERAGRRSFRQNEYPSGPVPMVARQGRYLEDSTFVQTAPPKYYLKDETGEYVEVSPESLGIEVDSTSKIDTIPSDSHAPARPVRKHPWSNTDSPDIVWIPLETGDSMGVDVEDFLRQTDDGKGRPKRKSDYERKLELEKTALIDADTEMIIVSGKKYVRVRGEYKFHEVKPDTSQRALSRARRQPVASESSNTLREYVLDLRDPRHLEFARSIVDSLHPTDKQGFYKVRVPKETATRLRKRGIPRADPHQHTESHGSSDADSESDGIGTSELTTNRQESNSVSFYYEGFSAGWEGGRYAMDDNTSFGRDYWGNSSMRSRSIWCTGTGVFCYDERRGEALQGKSEELLTLP